MLYINSSVACLKIAPKWSFSYFQPILAAIFVTIAMVKGEINTRLLHFGYCSNKLIRKNCEDNFYFLTSKGEAGGGGNNLLMHVPL